MARGQLSADIDEVVFGNAEFDELGLGLNARSGEVTTQALRRVLDLRRTGTELKSHVAVLVGRALSDDLYVIQTQNCYRDMFAGVVVDAGHSHFLCNHT